MAKNVQVEPGLSRTDIDELRGGVDYSSIVLMIIAAVFVLVLWRYYNVSEDWLPIYFCLILSGAVVLPKDLDEYKLSKKNDPRERGLKWGMIGLTLLIIAVVTQVAFITKEHMSWEEFMKQIVITVGEQMFFAQFIPWTAVWLWPYGKEFVMPLFNRKARLEGFIFGVIISVATFVIMHFFKYPPGTNASRITTLLGIGLHFAGSFLPGLSIAAHVSINLLNL
ncbi:MAG: hypothetical protein GF308_02410 [Candidatus Heimdallarchaeota archaeon]|nr:hypothetical protein [Candidatus Heimdallarchaeota archaeon]